MRRLGAVLGSVLAALILFAHLLPFSDYFIELQPDGKSLGEIGAEGMRLLALALASVPLALFAVFAVFTPGFRMRATPWRFGALLFALGLALLGLAFRFCSQVTSAGGPRP
jgi:hypothetical protein